MWKYGLFFIEWSVYMLVPIQKKHVFEEIADQLQTQIENGNFKGGERLPSELQLCEIFQVSRGSIREAIKSLQVLGVLEARSGQGTYVSEDALSKISENRLREMISGGQYRDQILEIRYLIEPQAAWFFAQICTEKDIDYLRTSYSEMCEYAKNKDIAGINRCGNDFHFYIVKMLHNEILNSLYASIQQSLLNEREALARGLEEPDRVTYDYEHLELIEAFEKHDAELARSVMEKHLGRQTNWEKKIKKDR